MEASAVKGSTEQGSAIVESIFGVFILLVLALGAIQVALTLYARNIVMAAVHDAARAVTEIGGGPGDAQIVAERIVRRSAGGLVDELTIDVDATTGADRYVVTVRVAGDLVSPGPVPIDLTLDAHATATREVFNVPPE